MSKNTRKLGSFRVWLWGRLVEALVIAWWVSTPKPWNGLDLFFLALLIYVAYLADSLAYGYADEMGVTFRRYLRRNFVPWDEIVGIEWKPWSSAGVKLFLRRKSWRRRTLHFVLNASVKEAVGQFTGRSTPETVVWIQEHIGSSPHEASSADLRV